jgi:predicted alpha/beta-fold hydrolase
MNGFASVDDFYYDAACKNFLHDLDTPLLIVMASNDPIISTTCVPMELCKRHPKIKFEITKNGGHVGYTMPGVSYNWMDIRAFEFAEKLV